MEFIKLTEIRESESLEGFDLVIRISEIESIQQMHSNTTFIRVKTKFTFKVKESVLDIYNKLNQ